MQETPTSPSPPSDHEESYDKNNDDMDNDNDNDKMDMQAERNNKKIDNFTNKFELRMDELMSVMEVFEANFNSLAASRGTSEGRSSRGPKT